MKPLMSIATVLLSAAGLYAAEFENLAPKAQTFRHDQPVNPQPDGNIVAEAEEFRVIPSEGATAQPGDVWKAMNWGENYYAATMANVFLSRKAFLGAPEQCSVQQTASITVNVPTAGRYLTLVRYEAAYRFQTQFKVRVEQDGEVKLDRLYGALDNIKIWAFQYGKGLQKEVAWSWGAVENIVWEGHEAAVELDAGPATITLIADKQPEPAAKRNIDLVLLTSNEADVKERIEKERYLPLDGLLTQSGDVFMRVTNSGSNPISVAANAGVEHSPYWVHMRKWNPVKVDVPAGASSEWVDVGGLLDSLNDGAWNLNSTAQNQPWSVEFAIKTAVGDLEPIAKFESKTDILKLAYDANTRYSRRIRLIEDVLYDLLAYLKKQPTSGEPPKRTIIYGYTFDADPENERYTAARKEFMDMFSLRMPGHGPNGSGYIDLRGSGDQLETALKKITEPDHIRTVSLGDEIGLAEPTAEANDAFRAWAKARGLKPADVDPNVDDWTKINFSIAPETATKTPRLYYYSRLYSYHFGVEELKHQTDMIQKYLPRAGVGANYSPHGEMPYLGTAFQWISVFRRGGMTLPWSEDYTWQVPVATQQMTTILLDVLRAGNRYHPDRDLLFYVMPHWPGNTPNSWRRCFYGAVGHGATIINLFEFRPVQAAYTENHVSLPEMYQEVRKSFAELTKFEDIVQDGRVHKGEAALWYSETGDAWNNHRDRFGAAKRTLYIAARHQQLGVDIVDEEDALKGTLKQYPILYLTDLNVSRDATQAIADWVEKGGRLFATAGAGMYDEFNEPNKEMQKLLGVTQTSLEAPPDSAIHYEKQDMPFLAAIDTVRIGTAGQELAMPVFGAVSRIEPAADVVIESTFKDGSPALTHRPVGKGTATYCGFLPGLSYFKPAIPLRPVDRGSTDDAMAHFLPKRFDVAAIKLIAATAKDVPITVRTNKSTVEATLIESPKGSAIVLVNWSGAPVQNLVVTLRGKVKSDSITCASGSKIIDTQASDEVTSFTLDKIDVADALILR